MISSRLLGPLIFLALPVAVFLQSTLLAQALPGQMTPNLSFLLTVAGGFFWGAAGGAGMGMWAGALTGSAAGSLAVSLSLLYGCVGWLAGLHKERSPSRWTLPFVATALFALLMSGEGAVSSVYAAQQPGMTWRVTNLAWTAILSTVFLALPSLLRRDSKAQ